MVWVMITLKEQEAVEYLSRARSCLHPKEDNFSNLPLLASMLDIQIAFLQHTQNIGLNELAKVSIDATGFPELQLWLGDIRNSLQLFDGLKAVRAKFLGNFLQQVINASSVGISARGKELAESFKKDSCLTGVLQEFTDRQIKYLSQPPIYLHKTIPGLLCTAQEYFGHQFVNVPQAAGLKYVDSEVPGRTPFISYVFLNEYRPVDKIKLMTPNLSLISTSRTTETNEVSSIKRLGPLGIPVYKQEIDISEYCKEFKYNSYDYQTIKNIGKSLQNLHPAVLRAFLAFESAGFSDDLRDVFIKAIPELDLMIKDTLKYSPEILRGAYISQKDAEDFYSSLSLKIAKLFPSLPDDYCRGLFQIALSEALESVIKESDKLVQPSLLAPRIGNLPVLPVPHKGSLIKRLLTVHKS